MFKKLIIPFLIVSSMTLAKGIEVGEKNFEMHLPYFKLNGKALTSVNDIVAKQAKNLIEEKYKRNLIKDIENVIEEKKDSYIKQPKILDEVGYGFYETKNDFNLESVEIVIVDGNLSKNLSFNLDKKTGKILKPNDIFTKEGMQFLKKDLLLRLTESEQALESGKLDVNATPIIFIGDKAVFNVLKNIPSSKVNLSNYTYTKKQLLPYLQKKYR